MKTMVFDRAPRETSALLHQRLISFIPVEVAEKVTKRARVVRAMDLGQRRLPRSGVPEESSKDAIALDGVAQKTARTRRSASRRVFERARTEALKQAEHPRAASRRAGKASLSRASRSFV